MAISDLFSKRLARSRGDVPDVYQYDTLPPALRVQLVYVIRDLARSPATNAFESIVKKLRREHGTFLLTGTAIDVGDEEGELCAFVTQEKRYDRVLDAVELAAVFGDTTGRATRHDAGAHIDAAIEEMNQRFREHGVGYRYEGGQIVRVDSDLLHAEAVKPALGLLGTKGFEGPRGEFLKAHDHYRHERYEEAITDALKSFESTMKAICDAKKWPYDKTWTSKKLVEACFKNGLVDPFWQSHFDHLQGTLESGIATARNKLGGHGAGSKPREVPREIVAYVLHVTASTIVFLIESSRR